ncbi:hypothetical protein GCM10028803_08320 [Larkinella knui]|uniref:Uncharacterized protein n=1 Tax=Larkinella knui TaxID=2025310 RepID=A0A3P1CJP9_9BACT|nr:hypothetical protein [Larkinella knui]RRB13505.1 hypothetical protein EHT87_14645 [Larkinella knui]
MSHLTQTREWPSLKLSRWQVVQLSVLSLLIAAMSLWRFQYEQVLPKITPAQIMMEDHASWNDQSFAKTTLPNPSILKSQL